MMLFSVSGCCLIYFSMFFINNSFLPFFIAFIGLAAGVVVVGWAYPYTTDVSVPVRIRVMSVIIICASIIYYLINILSNLFPINVVYFLTGIPLLSSLWFTIGLHSRKTNITLLKKQLNYPRRMMLLICILIFGLCINGGFMYNVMYPSLSKFGNISLYFRQIPYVCTLALVFWRFSRLKSMLFLVYIATAMMGFSFIFFALFSNNVFGYFITEISIQSSFALLDLFLWTILGNISSTNNQLFKVFGAGLFANVFAIFIGGISGDYIFSISNNYRMMTFMFAVASIFLSILIIPFLNSYIEKDLISKLNKILVHEIDFLVQKTEPIIECEQLEARTFEKGLNKKVIDFESENHLISNEQLTNREKEILSYILRGNTNRIIANSIGISDNTLKTHIRNIFRKFGVSSKHELLALALDYYNSNDILEGVKN